MNETEQQSIILNTAWGMIDGMVNWAMFVKHDDPGPTNMMFNTERDRTLFLILLRDFLSHLTAFRGEPIPLGLKAPPSNARPSDLTFLLYLRQVCRAPAFEGDARPLLRATEAFADWLEGEFVAPGMNLSDIDIVADLRVHRYQYLKICGDIAKHNIARIATNVRHIKELLAASGHAVSDEMAYLAVDGFFSWFHEDIFIYHSTQISAFLNDIRWAIHDYARTEYARAYRQDRELAPDWPMYRFDVPAEIQDPVARAMYWQLMNRVRARPWVHRFTVSQSFKTEY